MTHLFKISTPLSDMFISYVIDDTITYEVRGKDDGKLLEPKRTSKFSLGSDGNIHFDNRFIPVDMFANMAYTLQGSLPSPSSGPAISC